jgi:hypothetical protein
MTEPGNDSKETDSAPSPTGPVPEQAVSRYESAGIMEREGAVPIWLWIVAVVLLVWAVYYLVTYWSAPIAP